MWFAISQAGDAPLFVLSGDCMVLEKDVTTKSSPLLYKMSVAAILVMAGSRSW